MLEASHLDVAYNGYQVLWDASVEINRGEIVCLLGPNGAGKSTLMNTISGLVQPKSGEIVFKGERIDNLPAHKIVPLGLSHVLERRRLFPYLTVWENLYLGGYNPRAKPHRKESMEWVFSLFPILESRQKQEAQTLSGGEQQMLALARGLMSRPALLMADEPFLGLAPMAMENIIKAMIRIREEDVTIFFIEQNVQQALDFSDRGYILESGHIVLTDDASKLLDDERVKEIYLGQ